MLSAGSSPTPAPLRKNTRLAALLFSQFLGMVARGIYSVGLPLFVLERTGSALAMGISLFLSFAPFTLAAPFVGPLVDRFSRRDLLVLTNLLYGVFVFFLPLLHAPRLVYLIAFAASVCGVVAANSIAALLPELVDLSQLARVNSVYGFLRSVTFLLSTGSAFFLIQAMGKANIFFLCSALLALCAAACLTLRRDPARRTITARADNSAFGMKGLAKTLRIIRSDRHVRGLTIMHLMFMPIFGAFEVLLPLFCDRRLGEVNYYTLLSAAVGAGLALGSLFTYRLLERVRPLSLVLAGFCGYSAGVFLLSRTGALRVALSVCFSIGIVDAFGFTTYEFLRQRMVPSPFRGRVFAIMDALVLLPLPLGYLGMGYFAERTDIVSAAVWLSLMGLVLTLLSFPFTRGLPLPDKPQPGPG